MRRDRRRKLSAVWRDGALGVCVFSSFLKEKRVVLNPAELGRAFYLWGTVCFAK